MLNSLPFVHITPLGSGSHSPLSIQVVELGPTRDRSDGQVKLKVVPKLDDKLSSPPS